MISQTFTQMVLAIGIQVAIIETYPLSFPHGLPRIAVMNLSSYSASNYNYECFGWSYKKSFLTFTWWVTYSLSQSHSYLGVILTYCNLSLLKILNFNIHFKYTYSFCCWWSDCFQINFSILKLNLLLSNPKDALSYIGVMG